MAVKMKKRQRAKQKEARNVEDNRKFFLIVAVITVVLLVVIYMAYQSVA